MINKIKQFFLNLIEGYREAFSAPVETVTETPVEEEKVEVKVVKKKTSKKKC